MTNATLTTPNKTAGNPKPRCMCVTSECHPGPHYDCDGTVAVTLRREGREPYGQSRDVCAGCAEAYDGPGSVWRATPHWTAR